jgi:hypothetical protein
LDGSEKAGPSRYQVYACIKWHSDGGFSGTLGGNIAWDLLAERDLTIELPESVGVHKLVSSVVVNAIIDDNEVDIRGRTRPDRYEPSRPLAPRFPRRQRTIDIHSRASR